jgi:hypothetical protein
MRLCTVSLALLLLVFFFQGMPTSLIVEGVAAVWELLQEVNAACGETRVRVLDIGGGLSVDFSTDEEPQVNHGGK